MRWIGVTALIAGCSFTPGKYSVGGADDVGGDDDADVDTLTFSAQWSFDTAAEFGAAGHATDLLTIEPGGTLTPFGYIYGTLLSFGYQSMQLWSTTSTSYDYSATEAVTPDGIALWNTSLVDTGDNLTRVGITDNTLFTIWSEGEVYLDANDIVSIDADGAGFVDMKLPTGWSQIVSKADGIKQFPPVTTAGWYPVRIGWGEGTGDGFLDFRRGPSGTAEHFSRDRLRAAGSKLRGTMRAVFYRQMFGGASNNNGSPVAEMQRSALLAATNYTPTPQGSGGDSDWSARYFGQFYTAVAGTYQLTANTDDGSQLMLDGVVGSSNWARDSGNGSAVSTATANLAVGWHDLTFDYNQVGGAHTAALQITMAPDAALVGAPVPQALVRPVEPRRDRLIALTQKFGTVTIPNNSLANGPVRSFKVDGFAGEIATAVDVTFKLSTSHLDQLVFRVTRPGGTPVAIATHPTGGSFDGYVHFRSADPGLSGEVDGTWDVQVSDDTGGTNSSDLDEVLITIHTMTGPPAIATESTWISPVRDAGGAPVYVSNLQLVERALAPTEVFVRGCAMPDCSDDPTWAVPLGTGTATLMNRYMQLKIVLHSDGTTEPELDSLSLTYGY